MADIRILGLTVGNLTVAFGAPLWDHWFKSADLPLESGAAAVGVMTFFCVWLLQRDPRRTSTADSMRDAIAAAFVITYLVLVGWSAFFGYWSSNQPQQLLGPLTQQFTSNFTILTGVVVGFYFTSEAAKQIVGEWRGTRPAEREGTVNSEGTQIDSDLIGEAEMADSEPERIPAGQTIA